MFTAQIEVFVDLALQYLTSYGTVFVIQRRIFSLLPHVSFTFGYTKFLDIASSNARCRELPNSFIEITCFIGDPCCGKCTFLHSISMIYLNNFHFTIETLLFLLNFLGLGCVDGKCESSIPYFGGFSEDGSLEEFVLYLALIPIGLLAIIVCLEHRYFGVIVSKLSFNTVKPSNYNEAANTDVADEKRSVRQAINECK